MQSPPLQKERLQREPFTKIEAAAALQIADFCNKICHERTKCTAANDLCSFNDLICGSEQRRWDIEAQ